MADLRGFRQAGSLDLLETIEEGRQSTEAQSQLSERRRAVKAQAYAQICHAFGVKTPEDLSPAQTQLAEALEKRWVEGGSNRRGYGFSIDPSGRDPQVR